MTRILQIAKFYPLVRGGIEQVAGLYAEGLAEAGYEVDMLAYAGDGIDRVQTPRPGLTITRIAPLLSLYGGQFSFRYIAAVKRPAKVADIIHVHEPNPLATASVLACVRDKSLSTAFVWERYPLICSATLFYSGVLPLTPTRSFAPPQRGHRIFGPSGELFKVREQSFGFRAGLGARSILNLVLLAEDSAQPGFLCCGQPLERFRG